MHRPRAAGPVIGTEAFTITELGNGVTKISGLHVTDADATASTDTFTVSAATGNVGSSVSPSAGSGAGIAGLNAALDNGIIYDPHSPQPQTDSVTLTVADSFGHTDRVHFIFNQGGSGPDVALTGTSGKDVIFATDHADTLTGGAGADQFVFAPGAEPERRYDHGFQAGRGPHRSAAVLRSGRRQYRWLAVHPCGAEFDKPGGCPDHARQRSHHAEERRCRPACMPATSSCRRITLPSVAASPIALAPRYRCHLLACLAPLSRRTFGSHEAIAGIAKVVQAAHRLCPAAVPCAADRVCRAARRRSGAGRGNSRQDLRCLPAHRSAQEDGTGRSPSSISTTRAWKSSGSGHGRGPGLRIWSPN